MDKEASIQSALSAMRNNRPLRAEETCRDYLLMHPGCIDHLRLLGHALMKQDRLKEAEEQLRLALSLNADFPQLYEDLGSVLAMNGNYEEAIPLFEKAIRLEPRGAHQVHVCMGTACHVRGAPQLLAKVSGILGIKPGQTDPQQRFTLEKVHCLGCCALGPVMAVDDEYYSDPTTQQIEEIAAQEK